MEQAINHWGIKLFVSIMGVQIGIVFCFFICFIPNTSLIGKLLILLGANTLFLFASRMIVLKKETHPLSVFIWFALSIFSSSLVIFHMYTLA